jgi:hypothetical protein
MKSKILIYPKFSPIPQCNWANVQENVFLWLKKGNTEMIKKFCRKDDSRKSGYRFIRTEDLDETIIATQKIKGIDFEIVWFRRLHASNLSYYPLYFSEWFTTITLRHHDFIFEFKSDNDINNKIKAIKNSL